MPIYWTSTVKTASAACAVAGVLAAAGACRRDDTSPPVPMAETTPESGSFAADLGLIQQHSPIVLLASSDGRAQVAVAPGYQGRVMTSTATGPDGLSFGYVHRPGIEAGTRQPHMTVVGGEDRFWLGPEGGQFALYFPPGAAFDTAHWQVPEPIDWGAWPVTSRDARHVTFSQPMTLTNYARTTFTLRVDRTVRLLDEAAITAALGGGPGSDVHVVAFESDNRVTNTGRNAWRRETGLPSIWILGMFRPAPRATVVLPYAGGPATASAPVVNDKYFGPVAASRLRVADRAVYFRGDGRQRGKIGLPRSRARDVAGSYDPDSRVLTIVQYTLPDGARDYVNSMWEHQAQPYAGDVVNSYNDGPLEPGQPPLGPFYEIESSSPAAALGPGESIQHVHRTMHLVGPNAALDRIAQRVLGVPLADIASSLPANPE